MQSVADLIDFFFLIYKNRLEKTKIAELFIHTSFKIEKRDFRGRKLIFYYGEFSNEYLVRLIISISATKSRRRILFFKNLYLWFFQSTLVHFS
jgi:hypothetical protein